jgi:hypothetical protein
MTIAMLLLVVGLVLLVIHAFDGRMPLWPSVLCLLLLHLLVGVRL